MELLAKIISKAVITSFLFNLYATGSALLSIVGVYKEIQDQHMNIVSIMMKERNEK